MTYSFLYSVSFVCSKFLGLDRTLKLFRFFGRMIQPLVTTSQTPDQLENRLKDALKRVPLAAKCLDQAIVTWTILNLYHYPATLKIGLSITPLESHAWVVSENRVFVDTYNIPDLTVVAEYGPWE